jgi:hypothetical protein
MWDRNTLFPGNDEVVRFVADEDDEVRKSVKPQIFVAESEY